MKLNHRILSLVLVILGLTINLSLSAQAPQITLQPTSFTKCAGFPGMLTLTATGATTLTYQWYLDGNPVGTDSPTLSFVSLTLSDAGFYYCNISNGEGNIDSETVQVLVVEDAPTITSITSENSLVCIGTSNLFEMTYTGDFVSRKWYHESTLVNYGASYNLLDADLTNEGVYYCEVENACGLATSETVAINIVELAEISTQPVSTTLCEGEDATFAAVVDGDFINYLWLADEVMIPLETSNSLTIDDVTNPNITAYRMVAYNVCNNDTSNIVYMTVNNLPQITGQPINTSECLGTDVTLYAYADGTTAAEYQWFQSSTELVGETNASLEIELIANDTSHYYCEITNICGTVTTNTAEVETKMPPEITQQPVGTTLCLGDDITFQCKANGFEPISYQWLFDGADITGSNITGEESTNLIISTIEESQEGIYTCHVSNECGFIITDEAELIINTPPVVTEQPEDQDICEGLELTIETNYTGTEPLTFEWYELDGGTLLGSEATYTSDYADPNNSGEYYCILSNSCADVSTDTVEIYIMALPEVTTHPEDESVCVGEYAEMAVAGTGEDPLDYLWYRNGSAVSGQTNSTLEYPSAQVNQTGEYFCRIANTCGYEDSETAILNIGTEPAITWNPINYTHCELDTLNLIMDVQGENYTLQWYFNENPIPGANDTVLNIPMISTANQGDYYCSAFNACATVSTDTIAVTINEAPYLYLGEDLDFCEGESALLFATETYVHYDWNNGLYNLDTLEVALSGTFILEVVGYNSCKNRDTVIVEFHPYHDILFSPAEIIACGPYSLYAGDGAYSYTWNTSPVQTTSSIDIVTSGEYAVTVLGDSYGCETTQSVYVDVREPITFDLGEDVTAAQDSFVNIGIEPIFLQYVWNTGFEGPMLTVYGSQYGVGEHEFWLTAISDNSCFYTDTINVTFWNNSDISSSTLANEISIYPNPANNYINFEFNETKISKIEIYAVTGEQIGVYEINKDVMTLDVSNFAKGLYFIKSIGINNKIYTDKILIQ